MGAHIACQFVGQATEETGRTVYHGRHAVLATCHGKDVAVAPAFRELGITVQLADSLDTDSLGTFTGEVPRPGTMRQTAVVKARMGLAASGLNLAIASEGSFGPHPLLPFVAAARELMVFLDAERDLVVAEEQFTEATNFATLACEPDADVDGFLARVGFPSHAVILRSPAGIVKGIRSRAEIDMLLPKAPAPATLETDMRAHMNPTRMQDIARLAAKLARRIATACPCCGAPGFGILRREPGLPCGDCGTLTPVISTDVHGCVLCRHEEHHPRPDGRITANPAECPECNP